MSLTLQVDLKDIDRIAERIRHLGEADRYPLMQAIAFEGENQTRRRVTEEKAGPDGTPWPNWSPDYAASRRAGHALLELSGDLVDSIVSDATADQAEWGSNLIYFAIHDQGGTSDMPPGPAGIPQREILGLSSNNEADIQRIVDGWLERQVRDA